MADRNLERRDEHHIEPTDEGAPRDPVPGVLECDAGKRHSGWEGVATDTVSKNPSKQGSGETVEPMIPGNNSG